MLRDSCPKVPRSHLAAVEHDVHTALRELGAARGIVDKSLLHHTCDVSLIEHIEILRLELRWLKNQTVHLSHTSESKVIAAVSDIRFCSHLTVVPKFISDQVMLALHVSQVYDVVRVSSEEVNITDAYLMLDC